MKRNNKIMLSSLAVIAGTVGMTVGATTALFTSSSESKINVTAGKVNIKSAPSGLKVYSASVEQTSVTGDDIAGTLEISKDDERWLTSGPSATFASDYYYEKQTDVYSGNGFEGFYFDTKGYVGLTTNEVLISKMAPGDRAQFNLDVTNYSNIDIKWRVTFGVDTSKDYSSNPNGLMDAYKFYAQLKKTVPFGGAWSTWKADEASSNSFLFDFELPILSSNEYQNLVVYLKFNVEAVQDNAHVTDDTPSSIPNYIKNANNELKADSLDYPTQTLDKLSEATRNSLLNSYVSLPANTYLAWLAEYNIFGIGSLQGTDVTTEYGKLSASNKQKVWYFARTSEMFDTFNNAGYATYINYTITDSITTKNSIDVDGNICDVVYDSTSETIGKTAVIYTSSLNSHISINGPLDVVNHYGKAANVEVIAVAPSSYHEFGVLPMIKVTSGRVALENGSNVGQVHFNYKTDEGKFDNIILAIGSELERPTFSRDPVPEIGDGKLVVEVQDSTNAQESTSEFIWLTIDGLFEEIKVSSNFESSEGVTPSDSKVTPDAKQIAHDICNIIEGDEVRDTGLSKEQVAQAEIERVDEEIKKEIEQGDIIIDGKAARIGDKTFATLEAALASKKSGTVLHVLEDATIGTFTINDIKDFEIDLENNKLTMTNGIKLYDCDNVVIKNGELETSGYAFQVGEHQYTIIKWKYADKYPLYGYQPLAPAKNVFIDDLKVSGTSNKPLFYFTNIEDDLTRGAPSNYVDNDLYGKYIYKTGYTTQEQSDYKKYDEVFTACTDKDQVTVTNVDFTWPSSMVGNMHNYANDHWYTEVLNVKSGKFNNSSLARFVDADKYFVGKTNVYFEVEDNAPSNYKGKVNNSYFCYEGGANDAIELANFGEVVYIKESANVEKRFAKDDILTVVYEESGISYTGAAPSDTDYTIYEKNDELINNGHVFYSKFQAACAVYATGQGGSWKTATLVGEYAKLKDALVGLQSNYTIVILKDFTVGDEMEYSYGGGNYKCALGYASRSTIDFNGHTITYTGVGSCIVSSQSTGYLYIRDTVGGGGIYATQGSCFRMMNAKSDYTNFYDVNFEAPKGYALLLEGGTGITINSGRYISKNKVSKGWKVTTLTINGGTFNYAPNQNYIASGKTAVDNGDETWTVK